MTRTDQVLRALRSGARTSTDVASVTGIAASNASAILSDLGKRGIIRRVAEIETAGVPLGVWRLVEQATNPVPEPTAPTVPATGPLVTLICEGSCNDAGLLAAVQRSVERCARFGGYLSGAAVRADQAHVALTRQLRYALHRHASPESAVCITCGTERRWL